MQILIKIQEFAIVNLLVKLIKAETFKYACLIICSSVLNIPGVIFSKSDSEDESQLMECVWKTNSGQGKEWQLCSLVM